MLQFTSYRFYHHVILNRFILFFTIRKKISFNLYNKILIELLMI